MGNVLMDKLLQKYSKQGFNVQVGQKVRVAQKIQEGAKERIQNFEGVVIAMHKTDKSLDGTFTVRAMIDGIGVEKVFPYYSQAIDSIRIVGETNVRRSKLYYLRERTGKRARLGHKDKDQLLNFISDETEEANTTPVNDESNKEPTTEEVKDTPEETTTMDNISETTPKETTDTEPSTDTSNESTKTNDVVNETIQEESTTEQKEEEPKTE